MNYINNLINDLKLHSTLTEWLEFRARIKSPSSAITNDGIKALDDAFGMEIICANDNEVKQVIDILYQFMHVSKSKSHDKPNGYKAEHRYLTLKDTCYDLLYSNLDDNSKKLLSDQIPVIEFQVKTIAVDSSANSGSADHTTYKGIPQKEIEDMYVNGKLKVGDTLPRMWCSVNGKMQLLDDEQTVRKLYPWLDTTQTKTLNNSKSFPSFNAGNDEAHGEH